jgi:AhpD family alkylhydroperoxidase
MASEDASKEIGMSLSETTNAHSSALAALEREIDVEPGLRELVKLRASMVNGCAYCVDLHSKRARRAGESEQRIYALSAWHDAPFFTDRERAALALTDALTNVANDHMPGEVYEEAARQFDYDELTQLIWQIGAINLWNRVMIAKHAERTVGL